MVCSEDKCGPVLMWQRFPRIQYNDYYYMSSSYYDAVQLVCKRNIMFCGFGILAHYNNSNVTYKFKFKIDDELSEEYTHVTTDADKDQDKKWHVVNLKELFGIKPIKVCEDGKIDIMVKVANDDMRRTFYGTGGYRDRYSVIPEQDYDFNTEYSSHNDNNTSADWG